MTPDELRTLFNNTFGLGEWPTDYEVDHETYANVCQEIFNWHERNGIWIEIAVGPNRGIMFKNVELILSSEVKE